MTKFLCFRIFAFSHHFYNQGKQWKMMRKHENPFKKHVVCKGPLCLKTLFFCPPILSHIYPSIWGPHICFSSWPLTLIFSLVVTILHCGFLCLYGILRLLGIVVVELGSRISWPSAQIRGPTCLGYVSLSLHPIDYRSILIFQLDGAVRFNTQSI